MRVVKETILPEGNHGQVSAIDEHDGTSALRVHSDIRTLVVVQQPSLKTIRACEHTLIIS